MSLVLAAFLLQAASADSTALHAVRTPTYAPDGRVAVSSDGGLFLRRTSGAWTRLSTSSAWDRDPAFTRDGSAIVFSSDRSGNWDLWRLRVTADGAAGEPERVTTSAADESAPTTAPDGSIAFVRGRGASARIWIRATDGNERRLDDRENTQTAPRFSPDGQRVAYIVTSENVRRVIVRGVQNGRETTVNADRAAERLAWSPTGDRVAFSTRAGVFVSPADGRYTNIASTHHGDIAWSPDGATVAIAEYDEPSVGYNGDPDRLGERVAAERFGATDKLFFVAAPVAPDANLAEQHVTAADDRAARNAAAYDRVWERSTKLYFTAADATTRRAQWDAVRTKHRGEAVAARNDDELQRAIWAMLRERPPLKATATGRAAVSSAHPVATEAGLEMFRAGGNAVDAAVAVSFALGVVEPDASGVGGYGEMVVTLKGMERPTLIEFMSRVPEAASLANTSLLQNGRYPSDGPALVNVPGTVAGMYLAWKSYGSHKLEWKDLIAPALRAARNGYAVSEGLATTLATEREHYAKYEGSRALFFKDGHPLVAGDTVRNSGLAWVLEQIAANGADGFYKGAVADKWVTDLRAHGNVMTGNDLSRYYAVERAPVAGQYRGFTLWSSAPPVSGGAELSARMNLMEQFATPKPYPDDAATLNAALTAWYLVPSSRNKIADPGMWPIDVASIINRDTAVARWKCYDAERAIRPSDFRGDTLACLARNTKTDSAKSAPERNDAPDAALAECAAPDHAREISACHSAGTTAFTVADNDGNVVAVTQTLGTWGGNFYVTPGLGFLSNDKLTSYGTDSTQYGHRLPFARHGSTLAPTIVFKGKKPVFAVGAAGNSWITSAVFQALLGALDYGYDAQRALELPRFLPGGAGGGAGGGGRAGGAGGGGRAGGAGGRAAAAATEARYNIQIEDGFSPDVIKRLRELGYDFTVVSLRGELREGYGAAITIDGKKVTAGADPRRAGAAGAVP
ncbi:MAG: gamma-glutamyltransferase [Gemmatimonadetes bacterium]|nr:gamma-glutamyltransferase [Gemmatimonadota bacterium]